MAYSIKLMEITDPFAEDFGLVTTDVELQSPMSLADFLTFQYPDEVRYAYINMVEVPLTTIIQPGNIILVADDVGKKSTLSIVASLAVMAAAWIAAPYVAATFTGTTVATVGTGATMVAFTAISFAGNLLVNALLAPDLKDMSATGLDKSKSYLWSGARNQSQQMIPVPVVLGTFQIAGNLINTYTETHKVNSSGVSIRDTIYLLYGLTSNELQSVTACKINDMAADTFASTDRSVYYTLGTGNQYPLDTRNASALYNGEDAAPASDGVLFPDLIEEQTFSTKTIPIPYHTFTQTKSNITVFTAGQSKGIKATLDADLTASSTSDITVNHDVNVTIPSSGIIRISHTINEVNSYIGYAKYTNITTNSSTQTTLSGISRDGTNKTFNMGDVVEFINGTTKTVEITVNTACLENNDIGVWDPWTQQVRDSYTSASTSASAMDDIKIQIVFDRGLYSMSNKDGAKYERAVGFDFSISDGTTTEKLTLPQKGYDELSATEQKYCVCDTFISTHYVEFKVVDILKDAEIINGFTSIFLDSSKTTLVNHQYTIGIRMAFTQTHGRYAVNHNMLSWVNHAYNPSAENSPGTDFYDCHFSRISTINYNTILNYPNTSLLGLVLNATPVINNQLPKVTAVVTGKFYYYVAGTDSKHVVSTWTQGACNNPAYLAINMMYNDYWGLGIGGALTDSDKDSKFASFVDIDAFVDLANYCNESVTIDNAGNTGVRYTFDGIIDSEMSGWDAITLVLKAANATPIFNGNKITVYWDEASDSIVQLFTTSNIKEGSFTESFLGEDRLAECIGGNFIDSEDNYTKKSVIYLPIDADVSKRIDIELYGIVTAERAMRAIKQKLKKTQTLRQIFNFTASDSSGVSCEVGDKIGIQYEFIDFVSNDNSISGRFKAVSGTTITLDKIIPEITGTPMLIVRTSDSTIHTVGIINWDNTGSTTVLTIASSIANAAPLDLYLVGSTADYYKEAIVSSIEINDDLTTTISAINYDASIYDNFYGITINSVSNPEIKRDDVIVNNLDATYIPNTAIVVTWDAPRFGDADYYMVYKKTNESTAHYMGRVDTTTYIDTDFAINEVIYYKILPVVVYRGTPITIPLSWASYSNGVNLTSGLLEYLEAPDYDLAATLTPGKTGYADLTVTVHNPGGWVFKDRREGFIIWTRFSDSDATDDWFGPTDIILSSSCSAYGSTITVNKIDGLPTLNGQVCCLLLIDNCDLVAVYGNTGNTLNIIQHGITNANRKFALSKSHYYGVPVYVANKGFFPVKYFGVKESCTAYGGNNQISCTTVYCYDAVTNTMTTSDFDTDFMNYKTASVYVDGNSNQIVGIESFVCDTSTTPHTNAIILAEPRPAADFAIHLVGQDITGNHFGIYDMYWQHDSGYKTFKYNKDDDTLYGTIQNIPISAPYVWVALNRLLWLVNPDEQKVTSGWISNPKIYVP